jgi:hypothetical protein
MRIWMALSAPLIAAALVGCGGGEPAEPNPYPTSARVEFERSCPPTSAVCTCAWEEITRTVTYEEYQAAMAHFRETGLMEPKLTRARTKCTERHRE